MSFAATFTADSFPIEDDPISTTSVNMMGKPGNDLRKFSQMDTRTLAERTCEFLRDR